MDTGENRISKLRVLNLEDSPSDSELVRAQVESAWGEIDFLRVESRESFVRSLTEFKPDVIVSDFNVPGFDGKSALQIARRDHPHIPVVIVTGTLSDVDAVDLIKVGARDYVLKDNLVRLPSAIRQVIEMEQGIRTRKAMATALAESEMRFRALVETTSDVIWEIDEKLCYTYISPRITAELGYEPEEMIGKSVFSFMAPEEAQRLQTQFAAPDASVTAYHNIESVQLHKDGRPVIFDTNAIRVFGEDGKPCGLRGVNRNVTERKAGEARVKRLGKLYATLSQCNEHIMRSSREDELFPVVCRDAVELGGLKMAWIGLIDADSGKVVPVAHYGAGADYLQDIQISIDPDSPHGRGPSGTALREGKPFWCQDYLHDPALVPWHERGARFGWRASAALPLYRGNEVVGGITLYAGESHAFDEAVRNLLLEMAANISFALEKFAAEADRKRVTEELLRADELMRVTGEMALVGGWALDVPSGNVIWSDQLKRMYEVPPDFSPAMEQAIEFYAPEAQPVIRAAAQAALQHGTPFDLELPLITASGRRIWVRAQGRAIYREDRIVRLVGAMQDITARRRADEMLRKLSLAVEQSPSSIVITDLDARLEYVNEAFVATTGYSREEAIGQNPRILHSGKNARATYDDMWAHLTMGETWRGELVNRRKDGSEYVESILVSPVRDADGRTTHYLGIKEDITERKRVEQALLESERKFRAMTASAQDAIVMMDSDGIITFWNTAAEKIFGYAREESIGQEMHLLLAPSRYYEVFREGLAHFQRTGEGKVVGKTLELAALHKSGCEFPVELSLSAVNIAGKWQAIGILRDITERKQGEARAAAQYEHVAAVNRELLESNKQLAEAKIQLLQSEKLASIGMLAAGVAHEINNPVGYINSNLGTLEKYLADLFAVLNKHDETCRLLNLSGPEIDELEALKKKLDIEYLKTDIRSLLYESREGLERVKKIILDLRNFSRSEAEERWQWANIHTGLESTLTIVWNELKYKCEIVKEYAELPQIYCLPSQLNQVFMNLLVNAAQAIHTRGTITIRTGCDGDRVWLEIADTGTGISPEVLPRIFDPFFTTKPVGSGTGLGLPVSYGIIERHHGTIEVHSEMGKGATFRVTLPVRQPEDNEEKQ